MMQLRGRHYLSKQLCDFRLADGLIQEVCSPTKSEKIVGGEDYWVCPGLIDIQVNGYKGHDLYSDLTVDDVVAVAEELAEAGVTGFCPTVTTGGHATMKSSLETIAAARRGSPVAHGAIVGIHLEGPYISPEDGPRGAHPAQHVRKPDWEEFMTFQEAAQGGIRYITLAPDQPGALAFISRAVRAGIVVGIGHHSASAEQIADAVAVGATVATHLGNGTHDKLPRHDNYLWHQLAEDGLVASLIMDGYHLPPPVVKCFFRVKGVHKLVLVSDVIALAGLAPGRYTLMGEDVELVEEGPARLWDTPYLAGSTLKLSDGINNVMDYAEASFCEAVQMASLNPACLLGVDRERGTLRPGSRADLTLFRRRRNAYQLALTIAGGEIRYRSSSFSV